MHANTLNAAATRPVRDLDDLAGALSGDLIRPGEPDWDSARGAWQLLVDQRPAAVVRAKSSHDVVLTMRAAAALGLRVAAQSTGHNPGPLGDLSRTILLRTSGLSDISVDAGTHTARVGAGVLSGDLAAAAARHGLTAVVGFAESVGLAGLVLSGGLGWLARSHGPASAHVAALEFVTADAELRSAQRGSELFDLVLGGVDIAVVTALTLRLHDVADPTAGALFWPAESARGVFSAWRRWAGKLPDTVTSAARIVHIPAAPGIPPGLAGRAFVTVEAAIQGTPGEAESLLGDLRALGPELDTFRTTAPAALGGLHMDPPHPSAAMGRGALLTELTDAVLDDLARAATEGPARVLTSLEVRHLGGALDRVPDCPTRAAAASVYGVAVAADPGAAKAPSSAAITAAREAFAAIDRAVAPVRAARELRGFTEVPSAPELLFGSRLPWLCAAKEIWDPHGRIHAAHGVGGPAEAGA